MATVKLDPAKGIQIPNLTTTERNAISSPETGAVIWNTTTSEINQYNGSAWEITYTPVAGITSSADATAITIDSSERVGINTTTPSSLLEVKAGSNSTTDYPITVLNSAESVTTGYGAYGIDQSASSAYTIDVHDDLVIKSNTGENLRILENGGITFNGDTASANALDDYEEGTWTPVANTGTLTYANPKYTKIGNVVHLWAECTLNTAGNNNTTFKIEGMPFNAANSQVSGQIMSHYFSLSSNAFNVSPFVDSSGNIMFYQSVDGGSWTTIKHVTNISSGDQFYIYLTYRV